MENSQATIDADSGFSGQAGLAGSAGSGDKVDSAATSARDWMSVASVATGAFAFVTTEFLPVGLLPQIAHDLGVSVGTAGLMVTTPGLISAISAPAMLLAAGRINRRLILLILSVLLLASNLVSAFAPGFGVMLLGRALLGTCLGGFWTVALAASGRLVQQQHAARATAMIFAGITFATVIGVPLGTFISNLFSWRASFMVTGVLVAIALLAQTLLLPSLPSGAAVRTSDFAALLRRANPRKSLLMVGLLFAAHLAGYTYIAPFMVQGGTFGLATVSSVLLGFGLVGFVSNFLMSAIAARRLQASLFAMALIMMVCLFALPLVHASQAGVVALVLVWGFAYGAIPLCLSIWMQLSSPDFPEAGSALFVSMVQLSIAIGSFTGGIAVNTLGIPANMLLGGILSLIGLGLILSFKFGFSADNGKLSEGLSKK